MVGDIVQFALLDSSGIMFFLLGFSVNHFFLYDDYVQLELKGFPCLIRTNACQQIHADTLYNRNAIIGQMIHSTSFVATEICTK